jgi:predicted transcriptional regulator
MQKDHGEGPVVTEDAEPPSSLAQLTAEIVSAYVANNEIALSEIAILISAVGSQMAKIGTEAEPTAEERPEPAVPVRRSIQPDHLVCLVCGQPQKVLKRHLAVQHGLTPTQYRERFGLKPEYPMAAPKYVQRRRELALSIGLGRPKKPASCRRKSTARPKPPKPNQSATTDAGS